MTAGATKEMIIAVGEKREEHSMLISFLLSLYSPCLCHPQHRTACRPRPKFLRLHVPAGAPGPSSWAPAERGEECKNKYVYMKKKQG